MKYSEWDVDTFCQVYIKEDHLDPHSVFAERLGISRQDAKVLCHTIAIRTTLGKMYANANRG